MGSAEVDSMSSLCHLNVISTSAPVCKSLLNGHRTLSFSNTQRSINQGMKIKYVARLSREEEEEKEATGMLEEKAEISKGTDQDEPLDFSSKPASRVVYSSRDARGMESKARREVREQAEAKHLLTKSMKKEEERSPEEDLNTKFRPDSNSERFFRDILNSNNKSHLDLSHYSHRMLQQHPWNFLSSKLIQNGGERDHHHQINGGSLLKVPIVNNHRSPSSARPFHNYNPYSLPYFAPSLDRQMMDSTQLPLSLPTSNLEMGSRALCKRSHPQQQQQQQQQSPSLAVGQYNLHHKSQMYSSPHFEITQRSQASAFPGDYHASKVNVNGRGRRRTTSPTTSVCSSKSSSPSPNSRNRRLAHYHHAAPRSPKAHISSPGLSHLSKSLLSSSLANHSGSSSSGNKDVPIISPSTTSFPSCSNSNDSLVESVCSPNTTGEGHSAISSLLLTTNVNALYQQQQQQQMQNGKVNAAGERENGTPNSSVISESKKRSLPDDLKDDAYWERRRKNNQAAKRSRDARRAKEEEIAIRAQFLEQDNIRLKVELESLRNEIEALRHIVYIGTGYTASRS